jgi:hypothetical protein
MAKAKKLSEVEFAHKFIKEQRDESKSTGVHSVYSNFNATFKLYFDGADPVAATKKMAKDGDLESQFRRGGVMLYLPGEAPDKAADSNGKAEKILAGMGLASA